MRTKCDALVRISSVLLIPITLCTMAITVYARRGLAIDPQSVKSASARLKGNNLTSSIELAKTYINLPMAMEPNQGQTGKEVKFLSRGRGYGFFLTVDEAVLALHNGQSSFGGQGQSATKPQPSPITGILRMKLLGSNPNPKVIGLNKLPGKSNYFIGKDPANWRTDVPNYAKVAERGVYPGIDLIYYGNHQQLEYDFVLAPGANPKSIRLAINGARSLHINSNGDLIVGLENGHVMLHKPEIYQISEGMKEPVSGGFILQGTHEVAFNIGEYNPNRALVVDPVLSYSTYLGGSSIDAANGIAVAPDNTAFIAGGTFSSDFPTVHPLQTNKGGGADFPQDAFVSKISADGSTLLYSTFLGGSNTDVANSIAVDSFGNAYVTGTTLSYDFPVTPGSANTLCGGDGKCGASWNPGGLIVPNAFVAKLNIAGSGLVYSTFIGYYESVTGMSIAVDGNGNGYIVGQVGPNLTPNVVIPVSTTPPPPFPIVGGFQTVFGGGTDCYLVKLDATGSTIPYSTYIGGDAQDTCNAVAVDSGGNAYLTGLTYSGNFPISLGVPQTVYGGMGDAFLTKVNPNLIGSSSLVYSTYLGGNGLDQGSGVAVDKSGNAFVAGMTNSTSPSSFPVTANVLRSNCALDSLGNCEGDAFVAKMNPSGTALVYSTYLGGTGAEAGVGIALDTSGDAFLTGSTVSTDFPIAGTVFQPNFGGGNADVFVAELNPTGTALIYSTYLGGTNTDIGTGIAVDSNGSAYVTGQTCSPDFPLANPLQEYSAGNCDAFISKISVLAGIALNPSGLVFSYQSLGTTSKPLTISLTNGNSFLTIGAITTTGDFAQTNNCGTSIPAGTKCTISVTFTPMANGVRKGALTINDSAPGNPHVVPLTGTTSPIGLSTSTLSFGNQAVGVASPAKTIVVTNNGSTSLTFSGILASGDFASTDNCSVPLQPTTNCVISVTYTPTTTGTTIGAVTINDNASDSTQVVMLTGTGVLPDFGMSASPTSGSTFAGNPSTFTLAVVPIFGSTATVSLACSGAPTGSTCSITPASLILDGIHSSSATVTVTTTKRTMAPPGLNYRIPRSIGPAPVISLLWLAAVSIMGTVALLNSKRPRGWVQVGFMAFSMLLCGGCVGNSTKTAGTPAGNYTLTITGTSGTITHTSNFTLKVN